MARVKITQFAPTIGHSDATFIASEANFEETLGAVLDIYGIAFIRTTPTARTFTLGATYFVPSNTTLLGQPDLRPILQMEAGTNQTVIRNADALSGGFTENVTLKHLIIDQQGDLQTAGAGMQPTGIRGWVLEDIVFRKSYRFNFLCTSQGTNVPNNTGTVTFTKDSDTVTGSGTLFTTELSAGSVVKSAGNQFGRVESIESNTSLTLTLPWGYTTESGVTYKTIIPNSDCRFTRVRYEGTLDDDASGYGLLDDSTIEHCEAFGAATFGCGFVPDHARNLVMNNLVAHDISNSGISLESCEDITINNPVTHSNDVNGIQFISGTSRCHVVDGLSYGNTDNGYTISYNTAAAGVPRGNTYTNCIGHSNGGYAFRNGGHNTEYDTVTGYNNDTGGWITNTANSVTPDGVHIHDSEFYDDRGGSKSQDRGIWVVTGTNTTVEGNTALDSLHVVAGIVDTGTNTTLSGNTT